MDKLDLIPEIAPRYRLLTSIISLAVTQPDITVICGPTYWITMLLKLSKNMVSFDKNTADLFRHNVLEKGDSEDPMVLYKNFRGAEPSLEPLLKNRGMK